MANVRELREQAFLTQEELAQLAGVHRLTILKAEQGRRPSFRTIRKLAKALKVAPAEIEFK